MGICGQNKETNFNNPIKLHARIKIWLKESHGLYNRNAKKEELNIYNYIINNDVYFVGSLTNSLVYFQNNIVDNQYTKDKKKFLIKLNGNGKRRNYIENLKKENDIKQEDSLWVFNDSSIKGEKVKLKKNMFIRFGRQVVKILEIKLKNEKRKRTKKRFDWNSEEMYKRLSHLSKKNMSIEESEKYLTNQNASLIYCRICLERETEKNPFEKDLCKCSKTMPAHVKCLIHWLNTKCKKNLKKNSIIVFDLGELKCDICLTPYPDSIEVGKKRKKIIKYEPEENKPFMLFEKFDIKNNNKVNTIILVLELNQDIIFSIGRNNKNDLVFKDISVSREHAIFFWKENNMYVFDRESKFGTYFLVDQKTDLQKFINKEFVIDKFCIIFHAFNFKNCNCLKKEKWSEDLINTDENFLLDNKAEKKSKRIHSDQILKKKFIEEKNYDQENFCNKNIFLHNPILENKDKLHNKIKNVDEKKNFNKNGCLFETVKLNDNEYVFEKNNLEDDDNLKKKEEIFIGGNYKIESKKEIIEIQNIKNKESIVRNIYEPRKKEIIQKNDNIINEDEIIQENDNIIDKDKIIQDKDNTFNKEEIIQENDNIINKDKINKKIFRKIQKKDNERKSKNLSKLYNKSFHFKNEYVNLENVLLNKSQDDKIEKNNFIFIKKNYNYKTYEEKLSYSKVLEIEKEKLEENPNLDDNFKKKLKEYIKSEEEIYNYKKSQSQLYDFN